MNTITRIAKKDDLTVTYTIIYKNIRGTYLRSKNGIITVTTNRYADLSHIDKFVLDNICKISKKTENIESIDYNSEEKEVRYLGLLYPLVRLTGPDQAFFDEKIYISTNKENKYKKILKMFYYYETKKLIEKLYNENIQKFNYHRLVPARFIYKDVKSKWGSCNYVSKEIMINIHISKLEPIYAYYLLCHELVHLRYPNHQKGFHDLLEKLVPNHKNIRKQMNKFKL